MEHVTQVTGSFFRMKFLAEAHDILGPARAPYGRSHQPGQKTLYLSGSPEGTVIASRVYMKPDDPPRAIFPLRVENARILDLRDTAATRHYGIDTRLRTLNWQDYRDRGAHSPTWTIGDRIRALGIDGMIYASRSDPENTHHLTLFRWNTPGAPSVRTDGPPTPWPEDYIQTT